MGLWVSLLTCWYSAIFFYRYYDRNIHTNALVLDRDIIRGTSTSRTAIHSRLGCKS
jgi:hypothetical protein